MRRSFYLALAALFVLAFSGCGDSDTLNLNSFNNNNLIAGPVSGQTGSITLQTQVATTNQTLEDISVVQSQTIPASVNAMRFTGFDANGFLVYGPVETGVSNVVELQNVPVEVVVLRAELLVDGFTIGGFSLPVDVQANQNFVLTNPTYVFLGTGVGLNTNTIYGSFITNGERGLPEADGTFPASEAFIIDFPFDQVTNGITRDNATLEYIVPQNGDYLLTYSVELAGDFETVVSTLIRNGQYVANTDVDIADLDNTGPSSGETALQQFQHIVTLQAGDRIKLGVSEFVGGEELAREVRAQEIPNRFEVLQGTFTILYLGSGGTTGVVNPPTEV